jgi:hypothetical protein
MQGVNLVTDSTFVIWAGGAAVAPTHYTLYGTNAACARAGVGEADTNRKVGQFGAKITFGDTDAAGLTQQIWDAGVWSNVDFLEGQKVSFGCWVYTTVDNQVKIGINDGSDEQFSADHTSTDGWEFLTVTHTIDASATKLEIKMQIGRAGFAIFSGPTLVFGDLAPTRWMPSPMITGAIMFKHTGVLVVGDNKDVFMPSRPIFIRDIQVHCGTASTSGAWTFQIEKGDASWVDINGGVFSVDQDDEYANFVPAGNWEDRCLTGIHLDNGDDGDAANGILRLNIDSIGTGTSDVWWFIRCMQFQNPLECERAYNDGIG